MLLEDNISLLAAAPDPVKFCEVQSNAPPGVQTLYYWVVANYPIGRVVGGPFVLRNAPATLSPTQSVSIVWKAALGATSYDVLRTDTADFPQAAGYYARAIATTGTLIVDTGAALTYWNPSITPPSPVKCHIHLNNRDYNKPTLQIPCGQMAIQQIVFPDGSIINSGSGGGGQTPWLSTIDGGGNTLYNVGFVAVGAPSYNFPQNLTGATLEFWTDPGYAPGNVPASAYIAANQRTFPPGGSIPLTILAASIVTQAAVGLNHQFTDTLNNTLEVNGTIVATGASNSFTGMNYQSQELEIFYWIYNTPPAGGYIRAYDTGADAHLPLSLDGSQLNLNTFSNGPVVISLPTTAPPAGSHQLWADPADSYSVKWSV